MEIGRRLMSYGRSPSGSPKEKKSSLPFSAGSTRSHSPTRGSNRGQSLKRYKNIFRKSSVPSPKAAAHRKVEAAEWSESGSNRRPRDEISELTEAFRYFDADGDGKISVVELQGVLRCFGEEEVCEEEVRGMIAQVDSDGDGCIDLDDFICLNTTFITGFDADSDLREAFRLFDVDNSGYITPNALHQFMTRLGENSSLHDCHRMIKQVDFDGDGAVNFPEFKHMMTTTY